MAIIVFGYSGVFTTYTFMEPMIHKYAPFGIVGLTVCLFMFGLGGVVGNLLTGNVPNINLPSTCSIPLCYFYNDCFICNSSA